MQIRSYSRRATPVAPAKRSQSAQRSDVKGRGSAALLANRDVAAAGAAVPEKGGTPDHRSRERGVLRGTWHGRSGFLTKKPRLLRVVYLARGTWRSGLAPLKTRFLGPVRWAWPYRYVARGTWNLGFLRKNPGSLRVAYLARGTWRSGLLAKNAGGRVPQCQVPGDRRAYLARYGPLGGWGKVPHRDKTCLPARSAWGTGSPAGATPETAGFEPGRFGRGDMRDRVFAGKELHGFRPERRLGKTKPKGGRR